MPAPKDFEKMWRDLQARITRLEQRSQYGGTPIRPQADGSVQSDDFDGDLNADDAGSTGWAMSSQKVALGEVILRPGSIGNDSLTSPVETGTVNQVATNFAIPGTSYTTVVTVDVPVPAGYTRMQAHLTGMAFVVNPNTTGGSNGAGSDLIIAHCGVAAADGLAAGVSISGSNGQTSVTCSMAAELAGLSGGTVNLRLEARAAFQSFGAANPTNQANLSATVLWLR